MVPTRGRGTDRTRRAAREPALTEPPDHDAPTPPDGVVGRKRDHLRVALEEDVDASVTTGLERYALRARALPGRDLDGVDTGTTVLGHRLRAPLLVSCMTGGVSEAGAVNRALAAAAQHHGVALGLGSGRVLLEHPEQLASFAVRDLAPDVPLLANIGVAQLAAHGPSGCAELLERCEADVLVVHCNAVQEAVQPGGDTGFAGALEQVGRVCAALDAPVVVKEVGFGLGPRDVAELLDVGVAGVDVAGAGGTNWARVEGHRDGRAAAVAAAFADWGWPTALAVVEARRVLDQAGSDALLVGSGGVRDGVEACTVLCLGAGLVGIARGLLRAAADGPTAATEALGVVVEQLRVAIWASGAAGVDELGPHLLRRR